MITEKQGYEAMLHMLNSYRKLTNSDDITDILGGGEYLSDGEPADPVFFGYIGWTQLKKLRMVFPL